jgi:CTP synthase
MKFIVVSGGVVSGLGKGIVVSSLAFLLKSRGFRVTPIKIDMYFNVDAGTLRPQEHGEVFVTHDGIEADEDLGHYERFTHESLRRENYITAGQVYGEVIRKERAFEYEGDTVDVIPHVTDEIIRRIKLAGEVNNAEIVIVEFGGTVGEYKNGIFFEASRIYKLKHPRDLIHIHVTYLPYIPHIGELKSKPAQASVHILNGLGIQPEILIARAEKPIDKKRLDKLALFCNIPLERVFSSPDMDSIYKVPLNFHKNQHHLATSCLKLLGLSPRHHKKIIQWKKLVNGIDKKKSSLKIAMVGKYFATGDYKLTDSYVSVIEALKHAAWKIGVEPDLHWIDSEDLEKGKVKLEGFDGVVVPQGWGSRGVEGKIKAVQFARENKVSYLGLCFGMQMAVVEFARNVLGLKKANTMEAEPQTPYPVIHIMPNQAEYLAQKQYGGTIRLGAWPCILKKGTKLAVAYQEFGREKNSPWFQPNPLQGKTKTNATGIMIFERHRHRYEFNNDYRKKFEKVGLVIAGTSPDGQLVEAIEIKDHPFFVGTQFHPEYISRPLAPHPIFLAFLQSIAR